MIGEAFVRLRSDDSLYRPEVKRQVERASRDIERSSREMQRFGRGALVGTGALRQLGRAAAFASTSFIGGAGLIVGLKSASEAASNLNEQSSRARVIFGQSAQAIEDWSQTSASALLIARDQAIGFAGDFGTILRGLGQGRQEAALTSQSLVQLGADLASFANTPVPDALNAIRSGLVGEIEPLRRYGVILSEAAVSQKALELSGKANVEALTAQEKVQARLNLIFQQTTRQQGDVARTSGSLANQQRQLSANIRNLGIVLGTTLNPEINNVVTRLNEWLSDTRNQERVQKDFQEVLKDVKTVVRDVVRAFEAAHQITRPLIEAVGGLTKAIELLLLAMLTRKILAFTGALRGIGPAAATAAAETTAAETAVGGFGTTASGTAAKTGRLTKTIGLLGSANVVTFAAVVTLNQAIQQQAIDADKAQKNLDRLWDEWLRGQDIIRDFDQLEALRASRNLNREPARPEDFIRAPNVRVPLLGRDLSAAERRALELARTAGAGTREEVAAVEAELAADRRALAFAQQQIARGRGNTRQMFENAERLLGEVNAGLERLAQIRADNAATAERRRQEAKAAREAFIREVEEDVAFRLQDVELGLPDTRLTIAQVNQAMERRRRARIESLLGVPERLSLATQIEEQQTEHEETLVPFLQRELRAARRRLGLIRDLGATQNQILQQRLTIASIQNRIRDIRSQDRQRDRVNIFEQAAQEFATYGSNIAPAGVPLSPQDARGSLAAGILGRQAPMAAAAAAARGVVTVVQNFFGDRNPGQAIQQASQAARALR